MHCIRTVDEVVEALGGDTAVTEWTCMTQGAIANWKQRNWIPGDWHLRIYVRLLSMGRDVDLTAVFRLPPRDAAFLRRLHRSALEGVSLQ